MDFPEREEITQELLHELLSYHEITGQVFWKARSDEWFRDAAGKASWNGKYAGAEAGCGNSTLTLLGLTWQRARVVWMMHTGFLPEPNSWKLRCSNMNNNDTRIENLVCVSNSVSRKNRHKKVSTTNTSGICGVRWDPKAGLFEAQWTVSDDVKTTITDRRPRFTKTAKSLQEAYWIRKMKAEQHDYHFKNALRATSVLNKIDVPEEVVETETNLPKRQIPLKQRQAISKRQRGKRMGIDNATNKGSVVGTSVNDGHTVWFPTAADAGRDVRFRTNNINQCIAGAKHTHAGYTWIREGK